MTTHHLLSIVTKIVSSYSHVTIYTMESKDELVFVDFFLSSNTFCHLRLISRVTCPRQLRIF